MKRKILFFINPISGTRTKSLLKKKISQKCAEAGFEFEILPTSRQGDYGFLKEKVKRDTFSDIVVCGGDGSIRPVIAATLGIPVNIGIIPLGSGNGLAFSARIPASFDKAFQVIERGKTSMTDVFFINQTLGCMLCGIGLDAEVARDFSLQKKRGLRTYIKETVKNFFAAKSYSFSLVWNNHQVDLEAYFVSVANGNQFGNHFTIAPRASLSDGLLDIVAVKKQNKGLTIWSLLKHIRKGRVSEPRNGIRPKKDILYFQTGRITILNPRMAPLHIDGDYATTSAEISIQVAPAAYALLVP